MEESPAPRDGANLLDRSRAGSGETRDVAEAHPELVAGHRSRIGELSAALGTPREKLSTLTEDDADRLRALDYLE